MSKGSVSLVELFNYPGGENPARQLWNDIPEIGSSLSAEYNLVEKQRNRNAVEDNFSSEPSQDSTENEVRRSFETGREQGIVEGREAEKKQQSAIVQEYEKKRIEQVAKLSNEFACERNRFLLAAEQEVVKLALAIAWRILRREAQTDPLFLIGAVRVALGQLADTVQVRLRIPASEAQLWAETLAHIPNLKAQPTLLADANMHLGDCVIETEMGSVDLGLRAQLLETERVLFDNQADIRPRHDVDCNSPETEDHT